MNKFGIKYGDKYLRRELHVFKYPFKMTENTFKLH